MSFAGSHTIHCNTRTWSPQRESNSLSKLTKFRAASSNVGVEPARSVDLRHPHYECGVPSRGCGQCSWSPRPGSSWSAIITSDRAEAVGGGETRLAGPRGFEPLLNGLEPFVLSRYTKNPYDCWRPRGDSNAQLSARQAVTLAVELRGRAFCY